ncbi:hypothetical protein RHMOL_Rhmol01G0029600 [Rhododendron molle]|uniref:Uncharacterized protein n=1 Tax=Rhododendron molle TaxID=49168 RepID=A0ACC0PZD5_RHOML|nr:hypothetical protein RHMOL_Rhmol01G0029600 [Rhododendron molle]
MTNPYYEEAMSRKMATVERERGAPRQIAAASKRERETIDDDLAKLVACWDRCAQREKNMYRTGAFEEPVGPPFPDEVDQAYSGYGGVCEMDMRKEKWWVDYDMCAKLAVHKYNSYFKGTRLGELEFIKTLKVSSQIAADQNIPAGCQRKLQLGSNRSTIKSNMLEYDSENLRDDIVDDIEIG